MFVCFLFVCLVACLFICLLVVLFFSLQAFQQDITDHEPEFVSLKREIHKLCEGPDAESAYFDKASSKEEDPVGRNLPRPGQKEQDDIIADYENQLESLKKQLTVQLDELGTQLEKGKQLESLTSDFSSWLDELESGLDDLKIQDPKSSAIKTQQMKCQVCFAYCTIRNLYTVISNSVSD